MKIIISQEGKKLDIEFRCGKTVDKYSIDKADDFLICVDRILKKRKIILKDFIKNADLEFSNVGLLTERVIRAIMLGLSFNA